MNKALVFIISAEIWMTAGQICLKKSADLIAIEKNSQEPWAVQLLKATLRFPTIWIGALFMVLGLLFLFAALTSGELSFVYLLGSIHYVFALFAAHFFLHEKINASKLIGTLLITFGIILTAVS
jgi:uncharacterized membrane protein